MPKVDKAKGDIGPHEYEITTFDLGPSTKTQVKEDLDNLVASMKAKLDEETKKKKEYKREVERLKEHIQHLTTKPLDQEALLHLNPQEVIENIKEEKITTRETKDWMESIRKEEATFMEGISLAYEQTSSLLSRIENMEEVWADFQDIQDRVVPCLRELKESHHKNWLIEK